MLNLRLNRGFSLIEILLVMAILGIISAVAIPSFLGQRRRARVIGDAQTNARVLSMALETRRADNGTYGPVSNTYTWTNGVASNSTFLPAIALKNATHMNYAVAIGSTGLTYTINVTDPAVSNAQVLSIDQNGAITLNPSYNK